MSEKISKEELSQLLTIKDGSLVWICKTAGRRVNGDKAGCINKNSGHLCIEINGRNYKASHLVWLLCNGEYPRYRLEHKNGNVADDRIDNLVEVVPKSTVVDFSLVKKLFRYDDGLLIWNSKLSDRSRYSVGDIAGYVGSQKYGEYRYIKIGGKRYKAADLIWLYFTGEFPRMMLDHINHIKTDDRIENLRYATAKENAKNTSIRRTNTSGVTGVNSDKGKWIARINNNEGERVTLGTFKTLGAAKEAREIAEKIYGYHENHGK